MRHHNGEQNPTEVKLDSATMASPSGEDNNVPSKSSSLIPEYANIITSGLRRSKIIQEIKERIGIPNIFGIMAVFAYVSMSAIKSTLQETAIFRPS